MSEITEEIKKALEAAEVGPWSKVEFFNGTMEVWQSVDNGGIARIIGNNETSSANCHLIANAPTWLRTLLEENERLKGDVEAYDISLNAERKHSELGWEQSNKWLEENGRLRAELDAMTNEMKVYKHSYDATLIQYQAISTELAEKDKVLEWIRDAGTDYQSINKAREVLFQFKKGESTDASKDA